MTLSDFMVAYLSIGFSVATLAFIATYAPTSRIMLSEGISFLTVWTLLYPFLLSYLGIYLLFGVKE